MAGADPLNLTGEWLGGTRVPAVRHRSVHYRDGVPGRPRRAGELRPLNLPGSPRVPQS